jgi:hypothetical protein
MSEPQSAPPPADAPPSLPPVWSSPPRPPRDEGPRTAIAILAVGVLVLLVGAIVFVLLRGPGTESGALPSSTPSAASSPATSPSTEASPTETDGPSVSGTPGPSAEPTTTASADTAELAAEIAEVEAQVPPIRGLEPKEPVANRFLDEAALKEELRSSFEEDNPPEVIAGQQALYERLGLLPPDADLESLVLELLGESVAGFYDPDTKALTIVERSGAFGPLEKTTLAHEFTHALQDQYFGLDSLDFDDTSQGDRSLARLSLVEGDATLLMTLWAQQHLTPEELLELIRQSSDPEGQALLDRLPPVLVAQTLFPYTEGLEFVAALYQQGGYDAVDDAFRDPPDSTEQVIHPEWYLQRDDPVAVDLPDAAGGLGEGWKERISDTLGELNVRLWADESLASTDAEDAAEGWDGDRIALYENDGDAWAIAWVTAWDSDDDADEFAAAARQVVGSLDGEAAVIAAPGGARQVVVLLASDQLALDDLRVVISGV